MANYDPTSLIGTVRLLINDVPPDGDDDPIFKDLELQRFLDLEASDVRLAAAQALDVIASNEAYVHKRTRLLDSSTDGPAVAKALRAHADRLRDQAINGTSGGGDIEIAELAVEEFAGRERLWNEILREAG